MGSIFYLMRKKNLIISVSVSLENLILVLFIIESAADPGVVKTNIMREVPSSISHVAFIVLKLFGLLQLPKNGIDSILDAALAPPVSFPFAKPCMFVT